MKKERNTPDDAHHRASDRAPRSPRPSQGKGREGVAASKPAGPPRKPSHRASRPPRPALTPEMLLNAYASGAFPMATSGGSSRTSGGSSKTSGGGRVNWFTADPRAIIDLDSFHVPKSLARLVRQGRFTITFDAAFERVIRCCAIDRSPDNQCWINEEMIRAYIELHRLGHAHSVEAWLPDVAGGLLVGGLYGVHIGGAFFGESMFSLPGSGGANASKVCLVHLVERLRARGFTLLDTQYSNPHMDQFRPVEIPLRTYLARLQRALAAGDRWPRGRIVLP
jgi:leucyl/phenylalanyl-tRNA--protein transferase